MIYVSKQINLQLPVLLVDFSPEEIEGIPEAQHVLANLAKLKKQNVKIYTTQDGPPVFPGYNLPYWFNAGKLNAEFSELVPDVIQICGLYKELCLFQLASLLQNKKTPIIIDNDDYTIGATEETIAETPQISFINRVKSKQLIVLEGR